jgi:MFS family permease
MSLYALHGLAVVTVLPVVSEALAGRALYGAALAAYLVASLIGLAIAGSAGDRHGLARPFATGLGLFALGILGSAAAPSMPAFVAARALEGLGGGMLSAVLYATVNRAYPEAQRARVLAWLTSAWVIPGLAAPPVAGLVAETIGWRAVFLGLLPGVAVCGALVLPTLIAAMPQVPIAAMPQVPIAAMPQVPRGEPGAGVLRRSLQLAAGAAGLLLAAHADAASPAVIAGGAAGIALALPALRALLPAGTLRAARGLPAAVATKTLFVFAFFAADSFLPLALVDVHGTSAAFAGLLLTTGALSWTTGALIQARAAQRAAAPTLAGIGAALLLLGLAMSAGALAESAPIALAFAGWMLAGLGMGVGDNTANATAMALTPEGREGATSTALGMCDAIGVSLATGLGGAVIAAGERAGAGTGASLAPVWILAAAGACAIAFSAARMAPGARPVVLRSDVGGASASAGAHALRPAHRV